MKASLTLLVVAALAAGSMVGPSAMHAQTCIGAAPSSSVAYAYGQTSASRGHGARLNLVGQRAAFGVGASALSMPPQTGAIESDAQVALQFRTNRFTVCPVLGLRYGRSAWEQEIVEQTITTQALGASGGVAVGLDQQVYGGVHVTPFLSARYRFQVFFLSSDAADDDAEYSGDTVSVVDLEYGLTARYRRFMMGWSATRNSDTQGTRPQSARFFLGLTWGGRQDD